MPVLLFVYPPLVGFSLRHSVYHRLRFLGAPSFLPLTTALCCRANIPCCRMFGRRGEHFTGVKPHVGGSYRPPLHCTCSDRPILRLHGLASPMEWWCNTRPPKPLPSVTVHANESGLGKVVEERGLSCVVSALAGPSMGRTGFVLAVAGVVNGFCCPLPSTSRPSATCLPAFPCA